MSWTAGALVFSGRPDPQWQLDAAQGERLERLWERLEPLASEVGEEARALGYRGAFLRAPDGREWHAFAGAVRLGDDRRGDPEGEFEQSLLRTAPAGLLPAGE